MTLLAQLQYHTFILLAYLTQAESHNLTHLIHRMFYMRWLMIPLSNPSIYFLQMIYRLNFLVNNSSLASEERNIIIKNYPISVAPPILYFSFIISIQATAQARGIEHFCLLRITKYGCLCFINVLSSLSPFFACLLSFNLPPFHQNIHSS